MATVAAAVKQTSDKQIQLLKKKEAKVLQKVERVALMNRYEQDRLEQYSRREIIRINGIPS